MDQALLIYDTGTITLDVLAVHGSSEPDHISKFGITHEMLDGSLAEQIAGGRRNISIDFQVMSGLNRRKVVSWWLDPARQIQCLCATPTGFAIQEGTGGDLIPSKVYYYKIVAIDPIGNSIASTEQTATTDAVYKAAILTWNAATNARRYRIHRKYEVGGTYKLLDYSESNSYTDAGAILEADLPVLAPPVATSVINVITTNDLEFTWANGTELARMLHLELREATIFLRTALFPV